MSEECRYSCWLYLTVIQKDGEAEFERYVELPYPPRKGDILLFNEKNSDHFQVDSIEFFVPDDVFWLYGTQEANDCSCESGDGCCVLGGVIDYQLDNGWKMRGEPRYGFDRRYRKEWMFEPKKWIGTKTD